MQSRDYQTQLENDVIAAWQGGARNVMMVAPTGSGKTHMKSKIIKRMGWVTCCIAHRQELVLQISCALAKLGIMHNIIAPTGVVRFCAERHTKLFGRSYFSQCRCRWYPDIIAACLIDAIVLQPCAAMGHR